MPQQQTNTHAVTQQLGIREEGVKFEKEMSLQELKEYKEHVERVIERMEEEQRELTRVKLPELLLEYDANLKLLIEKLSE